MTEPTAAVTGTSMFLPNLVLIVSYVLIAMERIPKVVIALLGASVMMLAGVLTQEEAVHFIDFNVIFLLVGMMILVNILKSTGAIRYLALVSARSVNGSGILLMVVFSVMTAILSAFLDNVTTVLLLGSVTIAISQQLKINPVPFLITQVLASNIGGTATLIGDPPNIMIGSAAGLSFNDFLVNLAPVILIILPVTIVMLYFIYKDQLVLSQEAQDEMNNLSTKGAITDKPLMIKSLIVIGMVITGFILHHLIGQEAGTIALAGAALLMIFESSEDIWNDVEWTTIFFFIGLFIIVGGVEKVGTIEYLSDQLLHLTQGDFELTTVVVLWASGILSALLDNIPYTATMIPLIKHLGDPNVVGHFENIDPLWWSLALGACLGGNGTMIGATANVLVADMSERHGHPIRFLEFMKIGMLVMFVSLVISTAYLYIRFH